MEKKDRNFIIGSIIIVIIFIIVSLISNMLGINIDESVIFCIVVVLPLVTIYLLTYKKEWKKW